ncbi:MAG: flavin reductase family protein [Thermoplasmata archaeon]|nr:flavin reductase family protein [Thermoplasmata archaeon]
MPKVRIDPQVSPFPMPVTLVGALVDGRPNFTAVSWINRGDWKPPSIMAAMNPDHHTTRGLRENGTFSVNVPDRRLLAAADHCGLVSGKKVDKSGLFTVFYGELGTAPMIEECPVCLECRFVKEVEMTFDHIFVGEIVNAYAEESVLRRGKLDNVAADPCILLMSDSAYHTVGEKMADAWSVGKGYKKK